jgi:2,5-dihydroxypyridine 5,6-dioxygenase
MGVAHRLRELPGLLEEVLSLSEVRAGERVALVSVRGWEPPTLDAYRMALCNLGADFVTIELPARLRGEGPGLDDPIGPFAADVLRLASMIVWVRPPTAGDQSTYSLASRDIVAAGTRWLDIFLDEKAMRRLFPSQGLIERTLAGRDRMERAQTIRVTSESGTDLTVSKKGRGGFAKTCCVRKPGEWTKYGFASVSTAPEEQSAEGVLVFDRGDSLGYLLGSLNNLCPDRVRLEFRGGKLVKIEGQATAQALRQRLEEIGHPEYYRIAHVDWGTHDKAVWGGTEFTAADWESYYGALIVHMGPNMHGNRLTDVWPVPQHLGGTLLRHSLFLDDELIIENGRIVAEGLR